jgi:hypothetical protein
MAKGEYKLARVEATMYQQSLIGVDEDLNGREVKVYEIDKYHGMFEPNSIIVVESLDKIMVELGITSEYIFPTRWLVFK